MCIEFVDGITSEGRSFSMTLYYEGLSDEEVPFRYVGWYSADDGVDQFDVSHYDDLPHVVYFGEWRRKP